MVGVVRRSREGIFEEGTLVCVGRLVVSGCGG